jgi:hypothetical protein
MMLSALFHSVITLVSLVAAQTVHNVQVGPNGTLAYDPPAIVCSLHDLGSIRRS